jgi:hypothetical protein
MNALKHNISGTIAQLDEAAFFELFDSSVHGAMRESLKRYPTAEGLVCFENLQMDSSQLGRRTAAVFGPDNTFKQSNLHEARLGDVPSRFQYPRYIWHKQ